MRSIKIITPLLAAAFALTACGDGGSDAGGDTKAGQDAGKDSGKDSGQDTGAAAAEPKSGEELKKDVEVVGCEGTAGVTATLKVTNSLDEPMEYYGTINFLDGAGQQVAEGLFNTGTLEPGASSTEEVPGANVYEAVQGLTCEIVEVKLDEPA